MVARELTYAARGGLLRGPWRAATRPVAGRPGFRAATRPTSSRTMYVGKANYCNSAHACRRAGETHFALFSFRPGRRARRHR